MCFTIDKIAITLVIYTFFNITLLKLVDIDYKKNYSLWLKEYHKVVVDKFMQKRENWTTSVLGDMLFKLKKPPIKKDIQNKTFKIFLWKFWDYYERRFFYHFGKTRSDPLNDCSVKNCVYQYEPNSMTKSDAIVVWISSGRTPFMLFRNFSAMKQKWIFYTEESPLHTFVNDNAIHFFSKSGNKFNWSMTYRTDADIPIPYGRTIPLKKPIQISSVKSISLLVPNWNKKQKKVLVANMMTNCVVQYRLDLIQMLKKYIPVDFYGGCGDIHLRKKCPGHFGSDCEYLNRYHFYLALENSLCRQYITEKVFYNGYARGAIPIIKGAPVSDCEKLLPPHSFLHVDNYPSLEALAKEIVYLSENKTRLLSYHVWRAHFNVTNEAGFFGATSKTLCRICEALNYNNLETSLYTKDDMRMFLDKKLVCDLSSTEPTTLKPIVYRRTSPKWCYHLGQENCIEL